MTRRRVTVALLVLACTLAAVLVTVGACATAWGRPAPLLLVTVLAVGYVPAMAAAVALSLRDDVAAMVVAGYRVGRDDRPGLAAVAPLPRSPS